MPATRLRNLDWRKSLQQVHERGGSLDVTIATEDRARSTQTANVLWRVRLLELSADEFVIEQPTTLGKSIRIDDGITVVCILTIGQNRWMFRTRKIGTVNLDLGGGRFGSKPTTGVRLEMPADVERCQRRANYRVSTVSVNLPEVECWPLLDPTSVVFAERANELRANGDETVAPDDQHDILLPDVGPRFTARLLNLGGGGVGLEVPSDQAQPLQHYKLFWIRISLPNVLDAPICATAKVVHTHMTASQNHYAGLAFEFTFNPGHQTHVVNEIAKYVQTVQRDQLMRKSA